MSDSTEALDALIARLRYEYTPDNPWADHAFSAVMSAAADALEQSRLRIVETVEELDALPLDSVVVDLAGVPRTKRAGNSYMPGGWTAGGSSPLTSRELADGNPMIVVYVRAARHPSPLDDMFADSLAALDALGVRK